MKMPTLQASLLAALLCLAGPASTVVAQDTPPDPVPTSLPEIQPAPPAVTLPEIPPTPQPPQPQPPAPFQPSQPAPSVPKPSVKVPPSAPAPSPRLDIPLLVNVEVQWPALVNGKLTSVPFTSTMTIPGSRMALIRQRGVITESLDADLKRFLARLPSQPQDTRFEPLWNGWAAIQRNGLRVDLEKTRANILAAVKNPKGVKAQVVIAGQIPPQRTVAFFQSRGITTHLATGETNYYGSSRARITNIHVGASRFKDRLFEGRVFSFNRVVGPVNEQNGFVTGLVISGERTADGVGGGICQVSTTVFRALYGAGLPIVQRQNHSYQVHYYDPQGLDATIFQPSLDLKFANDTGGALWFQTEWNDREYQLTIHVFGAARNFTVQIDRPRVLRSSPSPANKFIDDPTMPAGQRKQVDWAAPGALVEVTRKFIRNGRVFKQDVLRSDYRPWPNIFLVGTRR